MGQAFNGLWAAFVASTVGTWLGFGAFPLIAIQVLGAGPAAVSALAATGLAAGALLALPLGPWAERHRRRPVMIATDIVRFGALLSIPVGYGLGLLSYTHLVVVSVIGAAANIAFTAASGAYLKSVVAPDQLLPANARFESTAWTAIALGPALGGAAVSLLGPVVTIYANAAGFLLSGLALAAIRVRETPVRTRPVERLRAAALADGWRFINADRRLRDLFRNTVVVNALIMATEPLLAVLLLRDLGWPAWQYGLAFSVPCVGGLLGARLATRLEARHGRARVLAVAGVLRVVSPLGLVLATPGPIGFGLVVVVEFVVITGMGLFNPLLATERLQRVPDDRIGRVLTAWTVTTTGAIAVVTALWGVLAALTSPRTAIGIAGVLLLFTPLLLPDSDRARRPRPSAGPVT
ncbi:MFS transporter [Actinoplanes sp. M2I2]|uniref:MFS transporter n=1 Tax=Actinoplanes sp. M2I2 TaxID=1734444 RepID=UPI0024C20E13|nr:MFS transporter [Actinoplanes sp. M2I2]